MAEISYPRGSSAALTPHFARREFDCPCGCNRTRHDPALSAGLETLRTTIGTSICVTSGYRCPAHNAAVGGAAASRHKTGQAADITCALNPVATGILASQSFAGAGIYWDGNTAFVHVDTRPRTTTWLRSVAGEPYRYTTKDGFVLPTGRRGSTGAANKAAIRMLQRLLGIAPDGIFGAKTETALKAAQVRCGIASDAICGPQTWCAVSGASKYL